MYIYNYLATLAFHFPLMVISLLKLREVHILKPEPNNIFIIIFVKH